MVIRKFHHFFNDWMPKIEQVLDNTDADQDAQTPGRAVRRANIEAMRAEINAITGTWTNLFP